jgi:hypothetical protein
MKAVGFCPISPDTIDISGIYALPTPFVDNSSTPIDNSTNSTNAT